MHIGVAYADQTIMKKIFVALCMALCLCASAQEKGDMAVGLNLGVAPCLESGADLTNFGIGAKFQYNVSNPVRLEAGLNYWFKDKGYSVLDIDVNAHYLISLGSKVKLYPLVGLGYTNLKLSLSEYNYSESENKMHINVGVGCEYNITEKISIDAEVKYSYIGNFQRLPIMIGVNYKF